jgi:hypothetical protein
MKGSFKYLLVAVLMICYTDLNGQFRYGQLVGINLSQLTLKRADVNFSPKITPGVHFGGYIELPVTRHIIFQPALLFTSKGSSYKSDSAFFSISPIYAEFPLNVLINFGSGTMKFTIFGGPYVAIGIGGNKLDPGGVLHNLSFGNKRTDDFKRLDIGYNIGAGLSIGGFLISAQYGMSVINLNPSGGEENEMKNRVSGITVTMPLYSKGWADSTEK